MSSVIPSNSLVLKISVLFLYKCTFLYKLSNNVCFPAWEHSIKTTIICASNHHARLVPRCLETDAIFAVNASFVTLLTCSHLNVQSGLLCIFHLHTGWAIGKWMEHRFRNNNVTEIKFCAGMETSMIRVLKLL